MKRASAHSLHHADLPLLLSEQRGHCVDHEEDTQEKRQHAEQSHQQQDALQHIIHRKLTWLRGHAQRDGVTRFFGFVLHAVDHLLRPILVFWMSGKHMQFVETVRFAKPFQRVEGDVAVGRAVNLRGKLRGVIG